MSLCETCFHREVCQYRHEGIEVSACKYACLNSVTTTTYPIGTGDPITYPIGTGGPITYPVPTTTPIKDIRWVDQSIPAACKSCSNHPSNGGSGICHCILGLKQVTC